uniref:Spermidine synthase n=1 Tax=Corvus moneduloides TaxID=1196302 RepID=A0A8U7NJV1_CORMO
MAARAGGGGAPQGPARGSSAGGVRRRRQRREWSAGGPGAAAPLRYGMERGAAALIREGWFRETCRLWPGQAMSLQVEELLHHQRSRYQEILVFRSTTYGNVLVLDGVIQCTERDEFSYQEMIANLPLCSHPDPRKVLIIGGGDGGVLREVVKHPTVESVVQCEIDEDVIQVSKKYLPGMAVGYSSAKLTLHVGDGFEFMKQNQEAFDVIITDSSDPMGPAESLFKESYYQLMKTALREDGILCCQGEDAVPGQRLMLLHTKCEAQRGLFLGTCDAGNETCHLPGKAVVLIYVSFINCWTGLSKSGIRVLSLKLRELYRLRLGTTWHSSVQRRGAALTLHLDFLSPIGECQWLHLDLIKEMRQFCKSLFPVVEYAYCTIPTYPSGQIGFMLCSKNPVSFRHLKCPFPFPRNLPEAVPYRA